MVLLSPDGENSGRQSVEAERKQRLVYCKLGKKADLYRDLLMDLHESVCCFSVSQRSDAPLTGG